MSRGQVQGPLNLISYPDQHQTLPKEVQEPQTACTGPDLTSSTSGLVYVWIVIDKFPLRKASLLILTPGCLVFHLRT